MFDRISDADCRRLLWVTAAYASTILVSRATILHLGMPDDQPIPQVSAGIACIFASAWLVSTAKILRGRQAMAVCRFAFGCAFGTAICYAAELAIGFPANPPSFAVVCLTFATCCGIASQLLRLQFPAKRTD